jgi:hypothetical protein|nr:MAG TPA: hypothetical protein [Caudoviricetes sp.]
MKAIFKGGAEWRTKKKSETLRIATERIAVTVQSLASFTIAEWM